MYRCASNLISRAFGRLELLPELKLEALQTIARLVIQRLCDADFKGPHGGDPGDSDAGGITQALLSGFTPPGPQTVPPSMNTLRRTVRSFLIPGIGNSTSTLPTGRLFPPRALLFASRGPNELIL